MLEMFSAVRIDRKERVERLLAGGLDVNSKDEDGRTALHWAMHFNSASVVRLLLARPETTMENTDHYGDSALHFACWCNSDEVIRLHCQVAQCTPDLLNKKNDGGRTPLMEAVYWGSLASVQELARVEGVDWETRDRSGKSLLQVARKRKKQHIVTFLEERAAGRRDEREETEEQGEDDLTVFLAGWKGRMANENDIIKMNITKMENEKKGINNLLEQNKTELNTLKQKEKIILQRRKENEDLLNVKKNELRREISKLKDNEKKIKEQNKKLLKMAGSDKAIPECPVCLERMTGEIYSCKNGHGICGACKPGVRTCATCRTGQYICRNTGMEQMVRAVLQEE